MSDPSFPLDQVRWGPDGLVPVVTRDVATGDVLMLAYMNREALQETLATGRAVYFSRSRGRLWVKGETSGNAQRVRRVWLDCDGDALLLEVEQQGSGACHTGHWSCFHRPLSDGAGDLPGAGGSGGPGSGGTSAASDGADEAGPTTAAVLDRLAGVIAERQRHPGPASYTARLLAGAPDAVLKKVAEESGEVLLAAKGVELAREAHGVPEALEQARAALAWEAADLLYHLLVALQWAGVPAEAVWSELARRLQAGSGARAAEGAERAGEEGAAEPRANQEPAGEERTGAEGSSPGR